MTHLFINIAILFLTIVVGVALFEVTVRFLLPQYDPSAHVKFNVNKDGVTLTANRGRFQQIKNTGDYDVNINISDTGLRESKPLKTAGSSDIFVVGDSFSFGWGVEENKRFSNQLNETLPQTQIFNISIPTDFNGYEKLLKYATKHGAKIQRLIIGVTMENNLGIYGITTVIKKQQNEHLKLPQFPNLLSLRTVKPYLHNYSTAYFLITSIIHNNPTLQKFMVESGFIIPNSAGIPLTEYSAEIIRSSAERLN